jgi:hypothetical protein
MFLKIPTADMIYMSRSINIPVFGFNGNINTAGAPDYGFPAVFCVAAVVFRSPGFLCKRHFRRIFLIYLNHFFVITHPPHIGRMAKNFRLILGFLRERKRFRSLSNRVSFPRGRLQQNSADIKSKKNGPWGS